MTLVKCVVRERLNLVEDCFRQGALVALALGAVNELGPLGLNHVANLLRTGLAQVVRFGHGEAGNLGGHPHDVFLVDHQAVGLAENFFQVGVVVGHRLLVVLAVGVVVVHVFAQRPRPIQRRQGRDVVERRRSEATHQGAHLGTFELEDADRITEAQHLKDLFVVEGNVVDVNARARRALNVVQGAFDNGEVAQPQEVHLEQPELLNGGGFILRNNRRFLSRGVRRRLALDRYVVEDRTTGDHDGRGVDTVLAALVDEPLCGVNDVAHFLVVFVHLAQFLGFAVPALVAGRAGEAGLEREVLAHHQWGHGLANSVTELWWVAQHTRRIADGGAGLDGGERDNLSHVVRPVAFGRVANHVAAVTLVEVHVDVGHLLTARVQEALEDQAVGNRVEVDDTQAVGDAAAGGRAATRTNANALFASVADQVPHHEEVVREAHVGYDAQFVVQALGHLRRQVVPVAFACAGVGQFAQEAVGAFLVRGALEIGGDRELGQRAVAELNSQVNPLGNRQCVVAGLGDVAEEVAHLRGGLKVVLVALEAEAVGVRHACARANTEQGVVHLVVAVLDVVQVVRGEERRVQVASNLQEAGVGAGLLGQAVVLHFDEEVFGAEDRLQTPGQLEALLVVVTQQGLKDNTTQAARGGDESFVMLFEQLPVETGLVVVALEEGPRGNLTKILVPGVVGGQQGQVVVQLLPTFSVATGVIDLAAARRPVETRVGRHVGLETDNRHHVVLAARLVEVDRAVEVAVVRDTNCRLPVRLGREHHFLEARRAVEHRILGVVVQMDKAVSHESPFARSNVGRRAATLPKRCDAVSSSLEVRAVARAFTRCQ